MSSDAGDDKTNVTTSQPITDEEKVAENGLQEGNIKTDDDKINEGTEPTQASLEAETDDRKAEGASPDPEYTPPSSSNSWSTMGEVNKQTDEQPNKADNEQTLNTDQNKTETEQTENMSEAEKQPEVTSEEETKTPEQSGEPAQMETDDQKPEDVKPTEADESTQEDKAETSDAKEETEDAADKTGDNEKQAEVEADKPVEPEQPKPDEAVEEKKVEESQPEEQVVIAAGPAIAKEEYEKKIKENDELQAKLASALSNQDSEKEAYTKLTDENAKLQKHYNDMKETHDEMEGAHLLMKAEIDTLTKVNTEQREQISKLETEVRILKESQGGDEVVSDLQDKLIRLSNAEEEKDKTIHRLEGELDATKEQLKDAENRAKRGDGKVNNSKTCAIM